MIHPSPGSQRDLFFPTPEALGVKALVGGRAGHGEHPHYFIQVQTLSYSLGCICPNIKITETPSWSWISQRRQRCTLPRWQGRRGQIVERAHGEIKGRVSVTGANPSLPARNAGG